MPRFLTVGLYTALDVVAFIVAVKLGYSEVVAAFVTIAVNVNSVRSKVDATLSAVSAEMEMMK